jgi:D-sedoheptulose 7-phosphate isomerase
MPKLRAVASDISKLVSTGGTIYWIGNGGSAADCQHLSTELVSRFLEERRPIDSVALTTNTSLLTAIANDYSFEEVFARQIQAHANPGDVLVAISTSGKSRNILKAMEVAKNKKVYVLGLTGRGDSAFNVNANVVITVDSSLTGVIQQCHITFGQALCLLLEQEILKSK